MTEAERLAHDALVNANVEAEQGLREAVSSLVKVAEGLVEARRQYNERLYGR